MKHLWEKNVINIWKYVATNIFNFSNDIFGKKKKRLDALLFNLFIFFNLHLLRVIEEF